MAHIKLLDVSMRDGNQSLWGATGLNTAQILSIAPVVDRVGFHALNFTSSTHMGMAVKTHREDPWERIRLTHAAMPNTPLECIGTGLRFISWEAQSPEFMQLVYDRLVANGISRFIVLDPMNDPAALLQSARQIPKSGPAPNLPAPPHSGHVRSHGFSTGAAGRVAASEPDSKLGDLSVGRIGFDDLDRADERRRVAGATARNPALQSKGAICGHNRRDRNREDDTSRIRAGCADRG